MDAKRRLGGKVAIVTASTQGIGFAIAQRLGLEGAAIVVSSRKQVISDASSYLRKGSSIILISSIAGYHPQASMAMYGVTKTALFGLTKVRQIVPYRHTELSSVRYGSPFSSPSFSSPSSFLSSNDGRQRSKLTVTGRFRVVTGWKQPQSAVPLGSGWSLSRSVGVPIRIARYRRYPSILETLLTRRSLDDVAEASSFSCQLEDRVEEVVASRGSPHPRRHPDVLRPQMSISGLRRRTQRRSRAATSPLEGDRSKFFLFFSFFLFFLPCFFPSDSQADITW
ncbi:hypothetical protein GW17_00015794 [Ensete ventricosum]|nr:hypothetical protein GW17_00015794 [Ensete ventricosum]